MKKLLLMLLGIFHLSFAMELTQEAITGQRKDTKTSATQAKEAAKDKARLKPSSSSSGSESDSSDKMTIVGQKVLLHTLELDAQTIQYLTKRLAQYEPQEAQHDTSNTRAISPDEKKKKHLSVVYMPPLNLPKESDNPDKDVEKGLPTKMTDKDYEAMVDHYAKEKGVDLSKIKGRLAEIFKQLDETPPSSPIYNSDKTQAIITYRKATQTHTVAHSNLATNRQQKQQDVKSRSLNIQEEHIQPRGPTIAEIIEHELGANPTEILENIAKATVDAYNQKLDDANSTQKKTAGGGAVATLVGMGIAALITHYTGQH